MQANRLLPLVQNAECGVDLYNDHHNRMHVVTLKHQASTTKRPVNLLQDAIGCKTLQLCNTHQFNHPSRHSKRVGH